MQLGRNDEAASCWPANTSRKPDRAAALRARLALAQGAADTHRWKRSSPPTRTTTPPASNWPAPMPPKAVSAKPSKRRWKSSAATASSTKAHRKAMLQLFEALAGEQYDDLVREFRRKMSAALN
jgi:putative thioredoxin